MLFSVTWASDSLPDKCNAVPTAPLTKAVRRFRYLRIPKSISRDLLRFVCGIRVIRDPFQRLFVVSELPGSSAPMMSPAAALGHVEQLGEIGEPFNDRPGRLGLSAHALR
jgi:hypothetical protein